VNEVRVAGNLVVVLTPPGHANGVGRAIDMAAFDGIVGTIAGDDTLLIIMQTNGHGKKLKKRLDAIAGRVGTAK
jgi:transcriptional regulator of arginine metabolism